MKTLSLSLAVLVSAAPAFAINIKLPSVPAVSLPTGGARSLPASGLGGAAAVNGTTPAGASEGPAQAVIPAAPASSIPNTAPEASVPSGERPAALDVLKGAAQQPKLMSSAADGSKVRTDADDASAQRPANKKWRCLVCDFKYDETKGFGSPGDDNYIAPGTRWEDVPGEWVCPDCLEPKSSFEMVEDN